MPFILVCCLGFLQAERPAPEPQESAESLVTRIVEQAERGEDTATAILELSKKGMMAARLCAEHLEAGKPRHSRALYEVIATAGLSRRSHPELLRLYDPVAYEFFYTPAQTELQGKIAGGLDWPEWSGSLRQAAVRTAPRATLDWMKRQAKAEAPPMEHLGLLLYEWAWWVGSGHERQHLAELTQVLRLLAANRAVQARSETFAPLIRLVGALRAAGALPGVPDSNEWLPILEQLAIQGLEAQDGSVRAEAAHALGKLPTSPARNALLARISREDKHEVLAALAEAAGNWPSDAEFGKALLKVFRYHTSDVMRRSILYSAASSVWPERDSFFSEALAAPGNGLRGAALQGITAKSSPELKAKVLEFSAEFEEASPELINALGGIGDARAMPLLERWLKTEKHLAVRLHLVMALEKIGGKQAEGILLHVLQSDAVPLVVEHVIAAADRMGMEMAVPTLLKLVTDGSAPAHIRCQALLALGRFDRPEVRDFLAKFQANEIAVPQTEKLPDKEADPVEVAYRLEVYKLAARLRLEEPGAEADFLRLFQEGTPDTRVTMLFLLEQIRRDHAVIGQGLGSLDFSEVYAAIRAASAANPKRHRTTLAQLIQSKFFSSLLSSTADTYQLRRFIERAIEAGRE